MKRLAGPPSLLAALVCTLVACFFVAVPAADPPAHAALGDNLVLNPSLEQGTDTPTCFSRSGWGTEAAWTFQAGRVGGRSVSLTIQGYQSGDRKLLQSETAQCAPKVTPGASYDMQIWYKSSAPVALTMFRHTAQGWSY